MYQQAAWQDATRMILERNEGDRTKARQIINIESTGRSSSSIDLYITFYGVVHRDRRTRTMRSTESYIEFDRVEKGRTECSAARILTE